METLHFTGGVAQVIFSNISYYIEIMSNYSLPVFRMNKIKVTGKLNLIVNCELSIVSVYIFRN